MECEKADTAFNTAVYQASLGPTFAKGDSSAIKMEFYLFPAHLSCSFSDWVCNEQFGSS